MSKRRQRGDNPDDILGALSDNEAESPFAGSTASDFADAGYGSSIGHDDPFAKLSRRGEKIRMTEIEVIVPDVTQPRRAIPSSLRHHWSGLSDDDSMAHFFSMWLEEVNAERREMKNGSPFPLDDYLSGNATARSEGIDKEDELAQITDRRIGAKEATLMKVVDLATSIQRDGLINPISIAQKDRLWQIETGERRWLAYQLLNWRNAGDEWRKIPARQVEAVSIWRQSTENNARDDLNAIAKARQFALLLMNLRSEKEGDEFLTFNHFEHEQGYYAQVSDGKQYRVPRGTGEMLINAMGFGDVGQLRHTRRLLRLPQIVWTVADDLDWTDNFLQKNIIDTDDTVTIRNGVRQALKDGFPEYLLDEYSHLLEQDEVQKSGKSKLTFSDVESSTLAKLEKQISKLGKSDRKKTIEYLEHLIEAWKQQ